MEQKLENLAIMALDQQYRAKGFTKYYDLISCLLVAEQNNELLMKNHETHPTGTAPLSEANATAYDDHNRGRGRSYDRGHTEIYVKLPEGFKLPESCKISSREKYAIKLNKSLYGVKQSGRMWLLSARDVDEEILGPEVPYLSAIGALMFLAGHTRLDIAFSLNLLARYSSCPTRRHWNGVK
nr:retrovirus-related Pol polyprotein from transposon TNT 1-94 [Tanacetum cinerariifolium]